jgi:hypothetical protein
MFPLLRNVELDSRVQDFNALVRLVLLAEYHDICERILDEHEIDAGLWAYRKGIQRRRRPASLKY